MKKILFVIKILIVLFLILFFFAGLNVTLSSENNDGIFISIMMLIVNGALVIGLSRKWFFPKKMIQVWDANLENTDNLHSKKERQSSVQVSPTTQHTPETTKIIVEPEKPIILENKIDKVEPKQPAIEQETRIETQPNQPAIEQETRIETQPKQAPIEQETRIEIQPKQPTIEQETRIEIQPKQPTIEQETRIEIQPKQPTIEQEIKPQITSTQSNNNSDEMEVLAQFPAIQTTFTYSSGSGKALRTVDISQYKKDKHGEEYIAGYCHVTNQHSDFAVKNIQTMMTTSRYPKYSIYDWLKNVAGVDINK